MRKTHISDERRVYELFKLLDDIDTLDDAVKDNDKAFREHTRRIQRKRFDCIAEDDINLLYDKYHAKPTDTN